MADNASHINYSAADIQRYLHGGMTAKEMHDMEKAALKDPFLADAIDGYSDTRFEQVNKHLNEINAALQATKADAKIVAMPAKNFGWWKIAASIVGVAAVAVVSFILLNNSADKQAVAQHETVKQAQTDSVKQLQEAAALQVDSSLLRNKVQDLTALTRQKQLQKKLTRQQANNTLKLHKQETASVADNAAVASNTSPSVVEGYATVKPSAAAPMLRSKVAGAYANAKRFTGRVVDVNNEPVPNAVVTVGAATTITDMNGNFDVALDDSSAKATIAAIGFVAAETPLKADTVNTITINAAGNALSDVVVNELNFKNKEKGEVDTVYTSAPVGGWPSFQEYVYKKLHKRFDTAYSSGTSTGQLVDLEFSVGDDGAPYDFKVNSSPGNTITSKTIEAIKQGPKWVPGKKQKRARVILNLR